MTLAAALTNNAVDVVISGPLPETEDIVQVAEHSFTDTYAVICAARHPLLAHATLTMHDLANTHWVMPPEEAEPRKRFVSLTAGLGVAPPHVVVETRFPAVIKAMVARAVELWGSLSIRRVVASSTSSP